MIPHIVSVVPSCIAAQRPTRRTPASMAVVPLSPTSEIAPARLRLWLLVACALGVGLVIGMLVGATIMLWWS